MDVAEAHALVLEKIAYQPGAFYGAPDGLALGAGIFFSNVRQPQFDSNSRRFRTVRGMSYVVTHECDVAQENDRLFNDSVLVCPVIRFEEFFDEVDGQTNLGAFLGNMATRNIPRLVYVPTFGEALPYGGVLYLNRITNTHVSAFGEEGVAPIAAVSATGLREVDSALGNLLMREKSDRRWGVWPRA